MSLIEEEYANEIAPLRNTNALKSVAVLVASLQEQSIDLEQLFGKIRNGHFLSVVAEGATIYVAFAANAAGQISESAHGNPTGATATGACWPIFPGNYRERYRLTGGRESGSGAATYASYYTLHYKVGTGVYGATGASQTGYLRLALSSLSPTQNVEEFAKP